jgi:hypothetical protein
MEATFIMRSRMSRILSQRGSIPVRFGSWSRKRRKILQTNLLSAELISSDDKEWTSIFDEVLFPLVLLLLKPEVPEPEREHTSPVRKLVKEAQEDLADQCCGLEPGLVSRSFHPMTQTCQDHSHLTYLVSNLIGRSSP